MLVIGAKASNFSKYDFKTIKVRPLTYKRLVKLKALIEGKKEKLHSFDGVVNHILDILEKR